MRKEIITLMGPTASGKTAIAMTLFDQYPIDIISVDSALIYKGMDIGTAKPTADELTRYPHQLINLIEPNEVYSVADFRRDALAAIEHSHQNNRIPLLVGGTMMYFKGLLEGLSPLPTSDATIRKQIEDEVNQFGWGSIHEKLKVIDPISAERIHPNDPQRLNRAYEVYLLTGQSLTDLTQNKGTSLDYPVHEFAIECEDRAELHHRIERRFMAMIEQGFESEVNALMKRGDLTDSMPSMRSVGYRQMWEYLSGESDYEEMIFKGICATRQLAKRQITWLRGWKSELTWVNPTDFNQIQKVLDQLI